MDAKKTSDIRQRLSRDYENLIKSINRNRLAAEEIKLENTEDEGDRATISHDRDLLYNLHEGGFARLRLKRRSRSYKGTLQRIKYRTDSRAQGQDGNITVKCNA